MHHYKIDLAEAETEDPRAYPTFNAFFTRGLKESARPVDSDPASLVSPADGSISQFGKIREGQIFQAKGHEFSIRSLLACSDADAGIFKSGSFATVYLSPRDYHRVHMPTDGKLIRTRYIPGKLFSVNNTTTHYIDSLFARNERLVCWFETPKGMVAVVLVGALFVAGIQTRWKEQYNPGHAITDLFETPIDFQKGDELGRFKFGSTVIVVTQSEVRWHDQLKPNSKCTMGKPVGDFTQVQSQALSMPAK